MARELVIVVLSGLAGAAFITIGLFLCVRLARALSVSDPITAFVRTHDKLALLGVIPLWGIILFMLIYSPWLKTPSNPIF